MKSEAQEINGLPGNLQSKRIREEEFHPTFTAEWTEISIQYLMCDTRSQIPDNLLSCPGVPLRCFIQQRQWEFLIQKGFSGSTELRTCEEVTEITLLWVTGDCCVLASSHPCDSYNVSANYLELLKASAPAEEEVSFQEESFAYEK